MNTRINKALAEDNSDALCEVLDEYKGSYAVKHFLETLITSTSGHTILSALELINLGLGFQKEPRFTRKNQ